MSRLSPLLSAVGRWLAEAAAGLAVLTRWARPHRVLRLTEGPDGAFRLERRGRRLDWETVREGLVIENGAFASPPEPAICALMRGAEVEVALQIRHFVVRPLELPARAAEFLDGVVRTQIDRVTPWKPGEAAFAATAPESLGGDRIVARVVATPRARLSTYLQALARLGIDALTVSTEIEGEGATTKVCVLTESLGDAERLRRWNVGLAMGLAVAAGAAVVALGVWSYFGQALDAEREALENAIAGRRAALLARRGAADNDAVAALDRQKQASLPVVLALESLSMALPDRTDQTELRVEQGKVEISGVTDEAPRLIRLIEQSRQFAHAAFSAPTTHSPNEAGERFHIEARIEAHWVNTP